MNSISGLKKKKKENLDFLLVYISWTLVRSDITINVLIEIFINKHKYVSVNI